MEESADKEQRKLTLTDKFAREKERKDISDWKTIYLYREGTFLRAFNASAWLLATYVYNDEFRKQVGGKQPLQVQHLMSKTNGDYIFAGFPVASIDKYITMCDKRDENSDVVVLTMCDIIAPLFQTAEEYEEAYAKYLASLPPAKDKKDKPKQQQSFNSEDDGANIMASGGLFEILRSIVAYPLEEKTPLETVDEFRRLKRLALRML